MKSTDNAGNVATRVQRQSNSGDEHHGQHYPKLLVQTFRPTVFRLRCLLHLVPVPHTRASQTSTLDHSPAISSPTLISGVRLLCNLRDVCRAIVHGINEVREAVEGALGLSTLQAPSCNLVPNKSAHYQSAALQAQTVSSSECVISEI